MELFTSLNSVLYGPVFIYVALMLLCLVFNKMVLKTGSWILGGAFFIFQMYIVSNMGTADETSFMLMLVIALIAFLKTWSDYNGEKTNKN